MKKRRRRKRGCLHTIAVTSGLLCLAVASFCIAYGIGFKPNVVKEIERELTSPEEIPFQEVVLKEDEVSQKYYYQQLNETEQLTYREILEGLQENTKEIYIHASDAERANEIFQFILKDCPDIFWCDGTISATSYEGAEPYTVLRPTYAYDETEKEQMKEQIEAQAFQCLSGISLEESDYNKILYVYEYIVNTVDYDLEAPDNQNIYSVFIHQRSVCAGYSKAAQYLLEQLGVFCTYVTGTTSGGQNHAWNLVKCEGDYYYMDVTWGDPVFQASEGEDVKQFQLISYDYMLCDDTELMKNHTPDRDVVLPACTVMNRNYYMMNNMYYSSYDPDLVLMRMNSVISDGENPVVLKFASDALYEEAHDDVFQNIMKSAAQNLADWYGLTEVRYQYMDEPELNKITVYWQYD
ncbi:hypothetical protein IMSAGC018_01135 [Lachnospiraceae bacterium]|nr:hypothetical protein IMSAGC018_01135 [Lachnospiraceae bacterium]